MSSYDNLKQSINSSIKENGQQDITGPVMNQVLNNMVEETLTAEEPEEYQGPDEGSLGEGYYTKAQVDALIAQLQEKLISGYNLKTVNLISLLGHGNIAIPQGPPGQKGDQGNSGYDGTGVEIVNNLTQGGATAALSAEMGKRLAEGYQYLGIATTTTNPGVPTHNVFYLASEAGTYTNFGGLVIGDNEVAALVYNGSWSKQITGAATASEVRQLSQEIDNIEGKDGTVVRGYEIVANEYVLATNGSFAAFNGWSRTGYVPIGDYSSIEIQGIDSGYNFLYDKDKAPLSQVNLAFGHTIDLSNYPTAKYIALSDTSANIANLVITAYGYKGNTLTSLDDRIKTLEQVTIPDGYMFGGEVTPSSSPSGEGKEFYLAKENGVYANFGGISLLDEVAFLREVETENLLHLDTLIPNKYIDTQGAVSDYNGWTASQKMSVEAGATYKVVALVNEVWTNMSSIFFAFYDANGNMTHRGVTTEWVLMESLEGDVTLAVSWDTHTIGESPMLVPSDFNPTSYIEPSGWNKDTIFSLGESSQTEIVLPSKLAFVQDKQFDMMVDNILYRGSAKNVGFKNLGSSTMYAYPYEDRIRINQPNEVISGTAVVRIQSHPDCAFDKNPAEQSDILTKSFTYRSVLKTQGSGVTKKVMFIGDSITANGVYPSEVVNLFFNDDMSVQLIGTLGQSPANHEGRGGWSAEDYCTQTSYNTYTNAFMNPSTGKFDFAYYMSENGFSGVDYVFISLGINDVYNQTKPLSESKYDAIISYYNEMITSIRAYNSSIKIFIGLPILPANSDWALSYNAEITKAERLGFIQRLIQEYDGRESEGFVLVPLYCVVDTERDFPTESRPICARDSSTVEYVTDQTHPKTQGYYKIADVMYTYIKYGTTLS